MGERGLLCSLYICCLIAHQHPLGSSTTKIKFYQEGLDGIEGRIPSRRKWLRAAQGSGGVPTPGGIQEMSGHGTEGCGSVMGLQRSGWWLAWWDLEAPFQPRRFCYSTRGTAQIDTTVCQNTWINWKGEWTSLEKKWTTSYLPIAQDGQYLKGNVYPAFDRSLTTTKQSQFLPQTKAMRTATNLKSIECL